VTLGIAIETTSGSHAVAVLENADVVFCREVRWDDAEFRDLGHLVEFGLRVAGRSFRAVERIGVDCGPGNRSSTRTGVAYANGLAFGLGVDLVAPSSLEIMAAESGHGSGGAGPILTLRRGSGQQVFGGLFGADGPPRFCRGPLSAVVHRLGQGLQNVTVAGDRRDEVAAELSGVLVKDGGVARAGVECLGRLTAARTGVSPVTGPGAVPLTDASPLFEAAGAEPGEPA
jgi:tRNA threonylcarbamoyladenosine biosynthesis protein TsaB